jgi:cytosine/adenosine deaminase-related metal-dependent hydrolase
LGTVLKGGVVVELEPATVERADLRIEGDRIVERAPELQPGEGDEVIALSGKLVLPGMVSAHSRLHAALSRGLPLPQPAPDGYGAYQQQVWQPYLDALDLDAVQAAAQAGALEALQCGTTCLFDLHASPRAVAGSLVRIARAAHEVGVRGVLSYAVTDRRGPQGREEGLEETVTFVRKARGRFRGQVGASALCELADEALKALAQAVAVTGRGVHLPLAEDPLDEKLSQERFGATPVTRLVGTGLLGPQSVVAHVGHLAWPELSQVLTTGAWVVHTPRSNMGQEVGYAPALKFGARASLGADTLGADLFAEAQTAYLRSREAGQPIDVLRYLANGHRLASQVFELPVGPMRAGAAADLLVLDYRPSTPMVPENLAWHVVYGLSSRHVEAVMVEGGWRVWARRPLSVNPDVVADQAREAAAAVWSRIQRPPPSP